MKREDYKPFVWYDVSDENYWVEDYPEEFPNCRTIVYKSETGFYFRENIYLSWGTMAKDNYRYDFGWKFMIVEEPKN